MNTNPKTALQLGTTIQTTDSIRYLGAELTANKAKNNATFLISTERIAKEIIKRCKVICKIRKYKIPQGVFKQA